METITQTQIGDMRLRLRITSDVYDGEIESNISSALLELERSGVANRNLSDMLVFTACEFWCKAMLNFNGESERYFDSFARLQKSLTMSTGWRTSDE